MSKPFDDREPPRIDAHGIKPPAAYEIEQATAGGGLTVLLLRGELDLAAAASLRARTDAVSGKGLVIDLGEVTFADSSALLELMHARAGLEQRGARLILAGVQGNVRRLLEMTGTAALFELASTREEALARLWD